MTLTIERIEILLLIRRGSHRALGSTATPDLTCRERGLNCQTFSCASIKLIRAWEDDVRAGDGTSAD